jgi:hypothetical protein
MTGATEQPAQADGPGSWAAAEDVTSTNPKTMAKCFIPSSNPLDTVKHKM